MVELEELDASGRFTNFGPINQRFEDAMVSRVFGGVGGCMTVSNATLGLILAVRDAVGEGRTQRRYALMPSFTFAAAAQATLWCGLTPLFCDIDENTWCASANAEEELLWRYRDEIAVVMPYAAFGYSIDLARYERVTERYGIQVVVDAAASLGSVDGSGRGFGAGSRQPVVFSMNATKPFATFEGGLIYCADAPKLARLRAMANFGFTEPRVATLPGLNAKLPEIGALIGLAKLGEFDEVMRHREFLAQRYSANLPGWTFQHRRGLRTAHAFMPVLLPRRSASHRDMVLERLAERGIGAAAYFSPHLAEQPYFRDRSVRGDLRVTEDVGQRMLSLPISDGLTVEDVDWICAVLRACVGQLPEGDAVSLGEFKAARRR